ncbi:MAG: cell division protein FtsQ, partial [Bacteroidia bacterium]|nr:cell division protein FtsQ [Bacteroidia bacterium]
GMHVTRLERVFRVADFLQNHPFWEAQIEQIYVNEKGELELIPRVGSHSVLIGEGKDLEKKFENLFLFYKEGLNKTGWNQYSIINLKYENQVVCTKK